MALEAASRVKQTTSTEGTSDFELDSPAATFRSFVDGVGDGGEVYYVVTDGVAKWEIGIGTVTAGTPDQLSRDTVIKSSNSDAKVNFDAGAKTVFLAIPGEKAVFLDSNGDLALPGASLLVGKSTTVFATPGHYIHTSGQSEQTVDGGAVQRLNRLTSAGVVKEFYQGGGLKGSIGVGTTTTAAHIAQTIQNAVGTRRIGIAYTDAHVTIGEPAALDSTPDAAGRLVARASDGVAFHAFMTDNPQNVCMYGTHDNASLGSAVGAPENYGVLRLRCARSGNGNYSFLTAFSDYASGNDLEFLLRGDGNGTCDGSWTGGGAGFGEMFEWADGNPDAEDRIGMPVVLDGAKIRPATPEDDASAIIGVISGDTTVVGNAAQLKWADKYLRDAYRRPIRVPVHLVRWSRPAPGEETVDHPFLIGANGKPLQVPNPSPSMVAHVYFTEAPDPRTPIAGKHPLLTADVQVPEDAEYLTQYEKVRNPDYNPDLPYVPREERPEWDVVSYLGIERVRTGQPVNPKWTHLRDVTDDVAEYLVWR